MAEGNSAAELNKQTVRRYYDEVWAKGDPTLIDELLTDGYLDHNPFPGLGADRAGAAAMVTAVMADASDVVMEVGHVIAEGDFVAAHWRMDWVQHGAFMGTIPADGQRLSLEGQTSCALPTVASRTWVGCGRSTR